MLSVKIEFCPLDWYSNSPTAIVLYNRMNICEVFPNNRQKLKKGNALNNSASPKTYRRR